MWLIEVVIVKTALYRLRLYVHEIGFHAIQPSEVDDPSATQSIQSWYHSAKRNDCLLRCLETLHEYLDYVLALQDEDILDFGLIEWITLVRLLHLVNFFYDKSCLQDAYSFCQIVLCCLHARLFRNMSRSHGQQLTFPQQCQIHLLHHSFIGQDKSRHCQDTECIVQCEPDMGLSYLARKQHTTKSFRRDSAKSFSAI